MVNDSRGGISNGFVIEKRRKRMMTKCCVYRLKGKKQLLQVKY
jgi:hypothetical protein